MKPIYSQVSEGSSYSLCSNQQTDMYLCHYYDSNTLYVIPLLGIYGPKRLLIKNWFRFLWSEGEVLYLFNYNLKTHLCNFVNRSSATIWFAWTIILLIWVLRTEAMGSFNRDKWNKNKIIEPINRNRKVVATRIKIAQ